jgi:hypothetical protein
VRAATSWCSRVDTGGLTRLTGTPAFVGERTWRAQRSGRFMGFDAVHNALALEGPSGWITGATWQLLVQPAQPGRLRLALADHRFVLLGGTTTYRFDANSGRPSERQSNFSRCHPDLNWGMMVLQTAARLNTH